jgi:hypothetical protein
MQTSISVKRRRMNYEKVVSCLLDGRLLFNKQVPMKVKKKKINKDSLVNKPMIYPVYEVNNEVLLRVRFKKKVSSLQRKANTLIYNKMLEEIVEFRSVCIRLLRKIERLILKKNKKVYGKFKKVHNNCKISTSFNRSDLYDLRSHLVI